MNFIIDRFEEEYAVVEMDDKSVANIPKKLLPKDVKEGDIIKIIVDKEATLERSKEISKLMDELWE